MKCKLAASVIVAVLIIGMLIPLADFDADTLTEDKYDISIPGTNAPEESIDFTLGNGNERSWNIYVVNKSTSYLDVSFNVDISDDDVTLTSKPSNTLLCPSTVTDHSNITAGVLTISVDKLSNVHDDVVVDFSIALTDISDKTSTTVEHIIFNVKVESIYDTTGTYNKFLGVFANDLPEPFDSPLIPFIVTIIFWMIVAEAACIVIVPRMARMLDKHTSEDDIKKFEKIISILVEILVFLVSISQGLSIVGADPELLADFRSMLMIVYIVLICITLWYVYNFIITAILTRFDDKDDSSIDMTLLPLFKMIGKLIFWIGGAAGVLGAIGVDLQGILVSAGVISLGITLGAQNVLSQFFSGLVILMTRPFKKGDFLKISGNVYIVRKVKLMFTEFYSWDKDQIITMPNNAVTSSTIVNLTKEDEAYRLYIYFPVAYGTDLKKAEEVMMDVATTSPVVLHDPDHPLPNVRMTSFQDSGIELRLGVSVKDFNSHITAASKLRMDIYQGFLDNDIEIPYNRLEVTMLNDCFLGEKKPGDYVSD